MTSSADPSERLSSHWIIDALGTEKVQRAHHAANLLHIERNLGEQLRTNDVEPSSYDIIRDVAFAYEIVASEYLDELGKPSPGNRNDAKVGVAEAAAYQAYSLLRSLPLDTSSVEELVRQVLQLAALAYCSDRWAEFRAWLRERRIDPEIFQPSDSWDSRVLSDLGRIWVRLLRKDGWADLEGVAVTVSSLRRQQQENEKVYLASRDHPGDVQAAGWRLVALYHWARISELVSTYLMQGEPTDVGTQLDFHFDRAIAAAQQSADPTLVVVLQWQRAMSHRMVAGSLWSVTRIGPEIRSIVSDVTRRGAMFEMLPPQRVAIKEQGLLDPASAAMVVDLPTSSGKTVLAEFKIVQAINQFRQDRGWVAYVAPTRALVSQITRRLRRDLGPSGIKIEQLTAAIEIDEVESQLLSGDENQFDVLVTTPEKMNLAVRSGITERPLALLVLDEAHNIEDNERGIRIELLLATVKRDCPHTSFLLLMPFVPNGEDLARWLAPQSGKSISLSSTPWQPNDRLIGLVSVASPPTGRGRDWSLQFEPLLTSGTSMHLSETFQIGGGPQLDRTYSDIRANLGRIAGASALTLSERGTSIVICYTIDSVWAIAKEIAERLPETEDPEIALVQRFLAMEVSPEFELINLLAHRVGVHHAGLSDETRALMEWLAEEGKLRILVSTTTLVQGLNFPVTSIMLASRNLPSGRFSRPMNSREFWNLAGRAGRVDQDSIGVVGVSCTGTNRDELRRFVADQAGDLVSRLVVLLDELERRGAALSLERFIYEDQWADFRSYVAHLFAQKTNLDAVLAETELLLRNTYGYSSLTESDTEERHKGVRLLEATRSYAADLANHVESVTLAEATGFTPEGIRSAMSEMRQLSVTLEATDWQPNSLFGDAATSALPNLMRVMLQLPQIRSSIEELSGKGAGVGDRAAKIAADWVAGESIRVIAERYFASEDNPTAALTSATKVIYRNLAMAGSWGLTALAKLPTSGIDFESLSESERRSVNLLGAMLYHGVSTEAGVVMRMSSVPRSVAVSLGNDFEQMSQPGDLRPAHARTFLSSLSSTDWGRHVPAGSSLRGEDLQSIWRILSGV